MTDAVKEAFQLVDERSSSFDPEEVREVLREVYRAKDEEIEALVQGVLEEGRKRAVQGARGLWAAFGLSLPREVEEHLWKGGAIDVRWGDTEAQVEERGRWGKAKEIEAVVRIIGNDGVHPIKEILLTLPDKGFSGGENVFGASTGRVFYERSWGSRGLRVLNDRAFLRVATEKSLDEVLQGVRALRLFFAKIGQDGLESALDSLRWLREGETSAKGGYVMAREERGSWLLWRGAFTGDPLLDGRLLAGKEVGLSFPGGLEISLRVEWHMVYVVFYRMRIRFGGEEVDLGDGKVNLEGYPLHKRPIERAIQSKLREEIALFEKDKDSRLRGLSPMMIAFLRALSNHEEPFEALKEGRLRPHVVAELFLDL